jgi:hypothetical protein
MEGVGISLGGTNIDKLLITIKTLISMRNREDERVC